MLMSVAILIAVNLASTNPFLLAFDTSIREIKTFQYKREFTAFAQQTSTPAANAALTVSTSSIAVPVLAYHGIGSFSEHDSVNITTTLFKEHMFALKAAGYETITLDELYAFKRGEGTLPAKPVIITFDDGRYDSYKGADPLLRALDYEAVMFVITKYSLGDVKNRYYLTERELENMQASAEWDIQPHTHAGHGDIQKGPNKNDIGPFYSSRLWLPEEERVETYEEYRTRIVEDMRTAKELVAQKVNANIIGFAFPFGDYGQNDTGDHMLSSILIEEAQRLFPLLFYQQVPGDYFSQNFAPSSQLDDSSSLVRRIGISSDMSASELIEKLKQGSSRPLPYNDTQFDRNAWRLVWGDAQQIQNSGVRLHAQPDQTGGSMILDGTRMWKDYSVTARVSLPTPAGITLWVRFANDYNNAACNFAPTFIHAEQTVEGEHRVIKGINGAGLLPAETITVGVEVHNRTITCLVDGEPIVQSEFVDQSLSEGGIGIKTWYQQLGVAEVIVHNLSVEPYETAQE